MGIALLTGIELSGFKINRNIKSIVYLTDIAIIISLIVIGILTLLAYFQMVGPFNFLRVIGSDASIVLLFFSFVIVGIDVFFLTKKAKKHYDNKEKLQRQKQLKEYNISLCDKPEMTSVKEPLIRELIKNTFKINTFALTSYFETIFHEISQIGDLELQKDLYIEALEALKKIETIMKPEEYEKLMKNIPVHIRLENG